MKKIFFTITLFSFIFWFTGCNEDSLMLSKSDNIEAFNKAGTDLANPNIFDANGNLCIIGDNILQYDNSKIGKPMELYMGVGNEKAGTLVGHVMFLSNPDRVRIDLTDSNRDGTPDMFPYVVNVAHIHFAENVDGIPRTKKGNPIPGQFEYNIPMEPHTTVIEIPVIFNTVGTIHLEVVKYGGIEGFEFYLPELVQMKVTEPGPTSLFQMTILNGGFISEYDMGFGPGVYESWCVDIGTPIRRGKIYDAHLYSSYEEIPEGVVDKPENLDLINYLVNNFEAGRMIQPLDNDCNIIRHPEILTWGDIQKAIWHFIDDRQWKVPEWDQQRLNAIICNVKENGEGFTPSCDQKIIFLVVPTEFVNEFQIVIGQPVIGEIEVPCETMEGTAWGDGYYGATFPDSKQWGTWFEYSELCE